MSIKEEIIDYASNKTEVDKWVALKGEAKYLQFVEILKVRVSPITWEVLSDTYRYDKRLLITLFKYMSFFEEFLRALIWNTSQQTYRKLEKEYIGELIDGVIKLKDKISFHGFSIDTLIESKAEINYLRNRISHNKIMLNSVFDDQTIYDLIQSFVKSLPESYRSGFTADINGCVERLTIPKVLHIIIVDKL